MHDVIVVGAGPAGLMTARTLAGLGHDVIVLEEHEAIGYPVHCTGVLGLQAFDEMDLPRETICSILQSAMFRSPSGRSVLVTSRRIEAAVLERGAFDAALAVQALAAGAALLTGARTERIEVDRTGVRVHLQRDGVVAARACVLACGASYRLNRALGLGVPRSFVQSAQIDAPFPRAGPVAIPVSRSCDTDCHDYPDPVELHLSHGTAPGGFGWVVPFRRSGRPFAKIGLMCQTRAASRFRVFANALATLHAVPGVTLPSPRLKILPLGPVARTYSTRLLAVGDAAGLVKPTTGGGIYYGLLSGRIAAYVLDAALRRDALGERALRAYELEWRSRLGPEIRAGLAFRAIAARLDDGAIEALVELAQVDGLVPLLVETADFNWHRSAALALLRSPAFRRIVVSSLWPGSASHTPAPTWP